ncbi:uncharacterized protein LOC143032560 isoform X2 [Oratosquilla oratoria]
MPAVPAAVPTPDPCPDVARRKGGLGGGLVPQVTEAESAAAPPARRRRTIRSFKDLLDQPLRTCNPCKEPSQRSILRLSRLPLTTMGANRVESTSLDDFRCESAVVPLARTPSFLAPIEGACSDTPSPVLKKYFFDRLNLPIHQTTPTFPADQSKQPSLVSSSTQTPPSSQWSTTATTPTPKSHLYHPSVECRVFPDTPIHYVLYHDRRSPNVVDTLQNLLKEGGDVRQRDISGDAPLHVIRFLLQDGLYRQAFELASVLLNSNASVDAVNGEGRTLLSYSVEHLDHTLDLTRLLLNKGASIWGRDEDDSAFPWFLKAVIRSRNLDSCSGTLRILSLVMADCPQLMRRHVISSMFRHCRCYKVMGPVFLQLKKAMMQYWAQPQSLTLLCRQSVRKCLAQRDVAGAVPQLGLPPVLESYILFHDLR